ncbi:MAG: FixH family protein [Chitinophagaceae bacterium]|jgi:hypothetical protein|nr:FixH family protein [Chitinophagaceae bacterium]
MSWGNKLVFVFIAFAGLIGTLVYKSMKSSFDLVSKDYYTDELRYQEKIDAKASAAQFSAIQLAQTNEVVIIHFPAELAGKKVDGEAWFYCSTNATKDRKIAIEVASNGEMIIPKSQLAKANYQVKISWKIGEESYYTEKNINLQ